MKSLEIKGSLRGATGKKDSRKLRGSEIVPCVLYGKEEPIHFSAPFSEFRGLIYSPDVFRVDLNLDGKVYSAILQATQWHPVDEQLMHADFYQIDDKKPIKIELPVEIVGTAKGIKLGGKLKVNLRKLKVKGFVKDFPDTIKVDVTDLDLSQIIKVGDMKLEGLQFLNAKSAVIVTVTVTRAAKAALTGKEAKK